MNQASLTRHSNFVYCRRPSRLRCLWYGILLLLLAPALGYAQYDSDSDGLPDYDEIAYIGTDPYNPDTDWDSMPDGWEYWNSLDPLSYDAENDPDGDNLLNYQEYSANTNPNYPDSDGDNMPDGWEVAYGLNPLSNDASEDPDNDGLTNLDEYLNSTNPFNSDTDGDYLTDYEEVYFYNTSPSNADSDNDGLTDSQELFEVGTDPNDSDADNDGIPDGPDPNPFVAFVDSDSDGLPDAWEQLFFGNLAQSASGDYDSDGRTNLQEFQAGTHPANADTDGDGFKDGNDSSPHISQFNTETAWVEDNVPAGATASADGDLWTWNWNSSYPLPVAGSRKHSSQLVSGMHQHYFENAFTPIAINSGDVLFAYVYLDPSNLPTEVMLQWMASDGTWWNHRAYWGQDNITGWGTRTSMGALPPAGRWVRLEVPAAAVGLVGKSIIGVAFTLNNGWAAWDHAGKYVPPDTDGDGLLDSWEQAVFGNLTQTGSGDSDADGSTNLQEFQRGTNPMNADSDADGLSDSMDPAPNVSRYNGDLVWVDDAVPSGAALGSDADVWQWAVASPLPASGTSYHVSGTWASIHQHFFADAPQTVQINTGDILFAYVYLRAGALPSEVMLQWMATDATWWNHRAYWGQDNITLWGTRTSMGALPPVGRWVRLEIPAASVGLEGRSIKGIAFTLYGGMALWDRAGKYNPDSDGDGIPDAWERQCFASLNQTATGDADGDGLTNLQEFQGGTDPTVHALSPVPGTVVAWGENTYGQLNVPAGLNNNVIAIVAGGETSLALKTDHTVVGWGYNFSGQATPPAGLNNVVAVACGGSHSLALKGDGTVVSWGSNVYGQNTVPAGLNNVVAIAEGGAHSVALKADGTVVAWGGNQYGQTAVPAGLNNVVAISAGFWYTLALKGDGTVVGWGNEVPGNLTPPAGLNNVIAISAGVAHALALKSDGTVVGWGWSGDADAFTIPAGLNNVVAVAAGNGFSMALKSDGTVVGFGYGNHGITVPNGLTGVVAISAGDEHAMALRSSLSITTQPASQTVPAGGSVTFTVVASGPGTLSYQWRFNGVNIPGATSSSLTLNNVQSSQAGSYTVVVANGVSSITSAPATLTVSAAGTIVAWGENTYGQLNVPAGLNNNVIAIVAGHDTSLAIKSDRTVVGWGYNFSGQATPPAGLNNVVAVACGGSHSLALKGDGTLVSWGSNVYGQNTVPAGLNNVVGIAEGGAHSVALKADGTVVAWGGNQYGQTAVPAGLNNVVAISAGFWYTLALKRDGTVVGWGNEVPGYLTPPVGLNNVIAISAGVAHALALKSDGTVVGWGWSGDADAIAIPAGLNNAVAVAAGNGFSVILKGDGTVIGFGYGSHGITVPSGLTGVIAITAGDEHAMALQSTLGIITQPASQTVSAGSSVTFTVVAAGPGSLSYQWRFNGVNIPGATSASLTLNNVQSAQAGSYTVVVANGITSVTSAAATLTVTTGTPTVTISAVANAAEPNVQGRFQVTRTGSTAASLTVNYSVGGGSATSGTDFTALPGSIAIAAGQPSATITVTPIDDSVFEGNETIKVTLTASGSYTLGTPNTATITLADNEGGVIRPGFDQYQLAPNDDGSTDLIQLGFLINFFGREYLSLYVNNNGNVTFDQPLEAFTPFPLSENGLRIIAPFWADVDTTNPDSDITRYGNNVVGTRNAFGVTWRNVGYYASRANKLNSFQLVMIDRADTGTGNFDIEFNYEKVQWETGDHPTSGGSDGLGGNSARAGYANGDNTTFELRGSGINSAFLDSNPVTGLIYNSLNSGIPGRYIFQVRNGAVVRLPSVTFSPPGSSTLPVTVSLSVPGHPDAVIRYTLNGQTPTASSPIYSTPLTVSALTTIRAYATKVNFVDSEVSSATFGQSASVVAWGRNTSGQTSVPAGLNDVIAISAGMWSTLVLKADHTVTGWGDNTYGNLSIPVGLTDVKAISAGFGFSMALKNNGTVVCWGFNGSGQCTVPAGLNSVTAIAAGNGFSMALKSDGTVVVWGTGNHFTFVQVPAGLNSVIAIAAGDEHCLALKSNGTVVGWGYNDYGQATPPAGLTGVIAVAAGWDHSLALKSDGTVVGWGYNYSGQTTPPAGLNGVLAIAGGGSHSLALKSNGTVVGWGYNGDGEVTIPAGLNGVIAISAGGAHSVALRAGAFPSVSINLAGNAAEPASAGSFTVTRTAPATASLVVTYSVSGSASSGADYTALSGSVTIPSGVFSAPINVAPINDSISEGNETVIVTLLSSANYVLGSPDTSTLFIVDDDAPLPTVTVSATADAREPGTAGNFRVTRSGSTSGSLAVNFRISGSATPGSDYTTLPVSVTIASGQTFANLPVTPINDAALESTETIVLTLEPGSYQIGTPNSATVNLIDDEVVQSTVTVVKLLDAAEPSTAGSFRVTRTSPTVGPLTVAYSVAGNATPGTDFDSLPASIIIADGQSSATVQVTPRDDAVNEGDENVVITLQPSSAYVVGNPNQATILIRDNDGGSGTVTSLSITLSDRIVAPNDTVTITPIPRNASGQVINDPSLQYNITVTANGSTMGSTPVVSGRTVTFPKLAKQIINYDPDIDPEGEFGSTSPTDPNLGRETGGSFTITASLIGTALSANAPVTVLPSGTAKTTVKTVQYTAKIGTMLSAATAAFAAGDRAALQLARQDLSTLMDDSDNSYFVLGVNEVVMPVDGWPVTPQQLTTAGFTGNADDATYAGKLNQMVNQLSQARARIEQIDAANVTQADVTAMQTIRNAYQTLAQQYDALNPSTLGVMSHTEELNEFMASEMPQLLDALANKSAEIMDRALEATAPANVGFAAPAGFNDWDVISTLFSMFTDLKGYAQGNIIESSITLANSLVNVALSNLINWLSPGGLGICWIQASAATGFVCPLYLDTFITGDGFSQNPNRMLIALIGCVDSQLLRNLMTLKWPSPRQPGEAGRDIAARIRLIIKMVSIIKSLGRGIGAVTTGVPPRWASVGVAAIGRPEFVNSDRLEECESEVVSINGWPRVNLGRTPCAGTIILFNLSTGSFWSENSNFLPECN